MNDTKEGANNIQNKTNKSEDIRHPTNSTTFRKGDGESNNLGLDASNEGCLEYIDVEACNMSQIPMTYHNDKCVHSVYYGFVFINVFLYPSGPLLHSVQI